MEEKRNRIYPEDEATLIPFYNAFYTKNTAERDILCGILSDNMLLEQRIIYEWFYQHFHFYSTLFILNKTEELLYIFNLKRQEIVTLIDDLRMNIEYNTSAIVSGQAKLLYYVEKLKTVVTKFERLSPLEYINYDNAVSRLTRGCNPFNKKIVLPGSSNIINDFVHSNFAMK
jgi:hypothetical protein